MAGHLTAPPASWPSDRWPALPRPAALVTATLLAAALVLGGGTQPGLRPDALVQLASVALLAAVAWRLARSSPRPMPLLPAALVALVAALPLAQLVPLPPSVWPHLPGRSFVAATYSEAGLALPSLPVSLDPGATWHAFLSLLPALAVALAVLSLDSRSRRQLTLLVILFAFASVLVGLAQVQLGDRGPLRLFERTSGAVGLFANRNHYAALLAAAMPLAAAWAVGLIADRRPGGGVAAALFLLIYTALLLGLAMARSRTGLALGGLAGLGCLMVAWTATRHQARGRSVGFVLAATALGLVLAANFALLAVLERLEGDLAADYRWDITRVTAGAAQAFFPAGSGFGTFPAIYRMFEPAALIRPFHANHAHNDALELVLEGGLPALLLLLLVLGWLAARTVRLWRAAPVDGRALDSALARAATIAAWLLLIHSLVDYPLRTTALMSVFALACGLIAAPLQRTRP